MTMTNTAPASPAHDDSRAKRNVAVLVSAQAILGAQMPLIFTVGGLAGLMIAPSPALATIPISLIVFGSMTTAPWLSALMQRYGRRLGFVVGAMGGAAGAGVSAWGLWIDSFALFLIGSYLTGIYMSAQGFYRFAATDTASEAFRPKAISYVMAGGLFVGACGAAAGETQRRCHRDSLCRLICLCRGDQSGRRMVVRLSRCAQTRRPQTGRRQGAKPDGIAA